MKRKEKTRTILEIYNVLSKAKFGKMDDADKIKLWKIARTLKPIATQFDEDTKDAADRLKPTEDFAERLQYAQEYENAMKDNTVDASKLKMGAEEYGDFLKEFKQYDKMVNDAIKEFADKEVEVEYEGISEDAFAKLMASNEWTVEQTIEIGNFILI